MKTACVISGEPHRGGIDEVHIPRDEGGKRRLGFGADVFPEQFMVIPFGHLPVRCPRTAKLDKLFHLFHHQHLDGFATGISQDRAGQGLVR
jgi:hypothetical protein